MIPASDADGAASCRCRDPPALADGPPLLSKPGAEPVVEADVIAYLLRLRLRLSQPAGGSLLGALAEPVAHPLLERFCQRTKKVGGAVNWRIPACMFQAEGSGSGIATASGPFQWAGIPPVLEESHAPTSQVGSLAVSDAGQQGDVGLVDPRDSGFVMNDQTTEVRELLRLTALGLTTSSSSTRSPRRHSTSAGAEAESSLSASPDSTSS